MPLNKLKCSHTLQSTIKLTGVSSPSHKPQWWLFNHVNIPVTDMVKTITERHLAHLIVIMWLIYFTDNHCVYWGELGWLIILKCRQPEPENRTLSNNSRVVVDSSPLVLTLLLMKQTFLKVPPWLTFRVSVCEKHLLTFLLLEGRFCLDFLNVHNEFYGASI